VSVFRFGRRPRTGAAEIAALERALARTLGPAALPLDRAEEIRARLLHAAVRPRRRRSWQLPCAALLVLGAAAALWHAAPPRLETAAQAEAPSGFEQTALDLHLHAPRVATAALVTASAEQARAWGRERTGVDVSLATARPPEDDGRFTVQRAEALRYREASALAIRYAVDGRPVTLLAARAGDVAGEVPEWNVHGKRVRSRMLRGHRVLSWANAGQAYALVSDLPGSGVRACLVCHARPARRAVIERMAR
jgi:hypothetical protein